MTASEFRAAMDEFFQEHSSRERLETSWWITLEDWSKKRFNEAYDREFQALKTLGIKEDAQ